MENASPIADVPVAHALDMAILGPLAPVAIAMCPLAASTIKLATRNGEILLAPFVCKVSCPFKNVSEPPAPDPKIIPISSAFCSQISSWLSSKASSVDNNANFTLRFICFSCFADTLLSSRNSSVGSFFTSA